MHIITCGVVRITDTKGHIVEEFLVDNNLCLFNDDTPTYLHPATGSLTSIDLTLSSPNIFLDFNWQVEEEQWGSDHYPVILHNQFYSPEVRQPRWQFHKANWPVSKHVQ